MPVGLKGSKTEPNLMGAFAGESQARNRHTHFASAARKEGFEQIAAIFEETANQEKEHTKRFFSFLQGGELEVAGRFPAGVVGTTVGNLGAAATAAISTGGRKPRRAARPARTCRRTTSCRLRTGDPAQHPGGRSAPPDAEPCPPVGYLVTFTTHEAAAARRPNRPVTSTSTAPKYGTYSRAV